MKTLLSRRDRHGWSWAELSRRSGLPVWTLRWWSRRLVTQSAPRRSVRGFVRVRVVEPPRADGSPLEVITSSGVRILVGPRFDPEHLRRVIRALEAAC